MIGRADIDDRVRAWGLREDVVEKDYVLGWVLWSIGADPVLGGTWIALAALAVTVALGSEPAPANHGHGAGAGRGPLCYSEMV